ncbi:MAG: acyl carrier protein [Planctomycetes bacterium GWF2_42_9]|nr:MAG: acyl carrier protein [Planctomycetes bacterium GWF2_42_9]HAL45395.1 acyl carrier protein [Phycisphaerales bacterium]
MAMSRDEIFKEVQGVLVDALGVDEEEVTPEAKLMGDLGAESIDFLDIVFRMEKAFGLKIPREELFPAENIITNKDYISNGKLTHLGIEELRKRMPHTDFNAFVDDPSISKIGDLFTVDVLVNFVEGKLK